MAKLVLKDVLNKISGVFKHDCYIINHKYCIGGDISEEDNVGIYLCILNDNFRDILIENFPEKEIIFFSI